jgi:uncharacterized protein (UPF0333 family)
MKPRGQSILEYVLVMTAIIVALIASRGLLTTSVANSVNSAASIVTSSASRAAALK